MGVYGRGEEEGRRCEPIGVITARLSGIYKRNSYMGKRVTTSKGRTSTLAGETVMNVNYFFRSTTIIFPGLNSSFLMVADQGAFCLSWIVPTGSLASSVPG